MSIRQTSAVVRACTDTGAVEPLSSRLHDVLAVGMQSKQVVSMSFEAKRKERDDVEEVPSWRQQLAEYATRLYKRFRRMVYTPKSFMALPTVLQTQVFASIIDNDNPCVAIGRFCKLNKEFAAICRADESFWKWLCWLRKFDTPIRMQDGWHVGKFQERFGPYFTWKRWFQYSCSILLTNVTIRSVLQNDLVGLDHPRYGPIRTWDTSRVTDMSKLLALVPSNFNQDIGHWDVSRVTTMESMFTSQLEFNHDIGNWDVSRVKNMTSMFVNAFKFNQDIGNWDVSSVESMFQMFSGALKFNQDVGNWDVSSVENMQAMFSYASKFNKYVGNWDVSRVANMTNMFQNASTFDGGVGNWNVSRVKSMDGMFQNALEFNKDIGRWDVSRVESMEDMFQNASEFNHDIGNWDVSSVESMSKMFLEASAFNHDLGRWKVSRNTDTSEMFIYAEAFNADRKTRAPQVV